jgi:hypothetical protein
MPHPVLQRMAGGNGGNIFIPQIKIWKPWKVPQSAHFYIHVYSIALHGTTL